MIRQEEGMRAPVATAFFGRFRELLPAQQAAARPLIAGENVVICSGTASGKTEAVVAPLVSRHWHAMRTGESVVLLYIAPTKALVNDLRRRLEVPCHGLGVNVGVRHGDEDSLKSGPGPQILITTPESLDVLLFRHDIHLQTIRAVVVDEVHLLYNTQRGLHLALLLARLRKRVLSEYQWAAISATIGSAASIIHFLYGKAQEATLLQLEGHRSINAVVRIVGNEAGLVRLLRKAVVGASRVKLLIFVDSRRECERVAAIIQDHGDRSLYVATHYSSLSRDARAEVEEKFSRSQRAVCVATSTLELGIDIGDIDVVILWGVPANVEAFLQRVGRGNRRGEVTKAVCLVPDGSTRQIGDAIRFLSTLKAARAGELSTAGPQRLFGAVAQQCLDYVAGEGGGYTRVADVLDDLSGVEQVDRPVLDAVFASLESNGWVQKHGFKNRYCASEKLHELVDHRLIYGNFGWGSAMVEVRHGSRVLGEVPLANLMRLHRGNVVKFNGRRWTVTNLSPDGIQLEQSEQKGRAIDFQYASRAPGLDPIMADRTWRFIHSHTEGDLADAVPGDVRQSIASTLDELKGGCTIESLPYIRQHDGVRHFTFAGYPLNVAISILTSQQAQRADDVSVVADGLLDLSVLPAEVSAFAMAAMPFMLDDSDVTIFQQSLPADLRREEYCQGWSCTPEYAEIIRRLRSSVPVDVGEAATSWLRLV